MLKNLKLYLELYQIDNSDWILAAWEVVQNNVNKELLSYCSKGYIFHYFHKLLNNEIKLEEFLKIWDATSGLNIYKKWVFLEALFELYAMLMDKDSKSKLKNKIILIENSSYEYFRCYDRKKYEELVKEIDKLDSNLCVI